MNTKKKHIGFIVHVFLVGLVIWMPILAFTFLGFLFPEFGLKWLKPTWFIGAIISPLYFYFFYRWRLKKEHIYAIWGGSDKSVLKGKFDLKIWWITVVSLYVCVVYVIATLAQPVLGKAQQKDEKTQLDLIVCMDVSNSMNTCDVAPQTTRLLVAKRAVNQLMDQLSNARISLIVFAENAVTHLPLTADKSSMRLFLDNLTTDLLTEQGTNIGAALDLATKQCIDTKSAPTVVVFTDGEDHGTVWQDEVKNLKKRKIPLLFVGVGTEKGGPIPETINGVNGFKRYNGTIVVSHLEKNSLFQMSKEANGGLYFAETAFPDMREMARDVKQLAIKTKNSRFIEVENTLFEYFLSVAIIGFLVYSFIPFIVQKR